jgi:beta-lactamase regulating signal transducer with metallopeptidase domain
MQTTFLCFSHNLNYALGWTVVHSLWQATVVALLSGVLMIALRGKTAKLRYLLSNLALFTVLAAAVATFCIYYDFTKEAGQVVFIPDVDNAVNAQIAAFGNHNASISASQNSAEGPLSIDGLKAYFNSHIYLIVTIWVMGVALFMLRLLGSISYVYYLKSRLNFPVDEYWQELLDGLKTRVGVQRGIDLLESAMVRSPIVIGHLKPVILFPIGAINRLNPQEVEAILAHELAHIMRNDYVFNIIQSVIEALFYFHPAVWWISAQIRNERENCCDDMAIQLCGNSMTYAKSLVSVQEMAYYSPQMAMAFAGKSNKNQLLLRVQRVLNQPQTKTNVREKLIATCVLVALMITLSFSSNRLNRSENDLFNSNDLIENNNDNNVERTENTEGSNFLKFINKNNELDSMPLKYDIKDGIYNFSDNTQTVNLAVKNNTVVQFNINGLEVASADMPKFEKMINRIVTPQPPTPPTPPSDPSSFSLVSPPSPPSPPSGGMHMQNNGNQLDVDDNGLHLTGTDENGKPINLSVDKNGLVMNGDNISMNISGNEDDYEEDAKPLEGLKNYNNKGQLMTIVSKNGTIQNFDTKGELISIFRPNGVVKNYKNKKLTTVIKNGKQQNFNYSYSTNNKTNNKTNDPYNTIHLKADNGFSYVNFTLNGNNIWKCYKNGNLLGDLTLNNNKPYYEGHIATSEELKRLGLLWYNNSFNPLTGGFQIVQNDIKGAESNTHYDEDDVVEERVEALTSRVKSMQQMVSGSKCRKLDPQWFTWANARLIAQKGLIDANKSKEGLDNVENELNAIQKQFDKIKANKKNADCGECKECGDEVGFVYSYGTDEQSIKNAERMAEQARRNAQSNADQARRNAEQVKRNAEQRTRDREQAVRDREQSERDREQAQRDREQAKRDATSGVAKDNLFRNLVKEGYLEVNKKCTVKFDNDALIVNGTALDDAIFKRYLSDYQAKLGKKSNFSMSFSGVITGIDSKGVSLTGRFSLSNDD